MEEELFAEIFEMEKNFNLEDDIQYTIDDEENLSEGWSFMGKSVDIKKYLQYVEEHS